MVVVEGNTKRALLSATALLGAGEVEGEKSMQVPRLQPFYTIFYIEFDLTNVRLLFVRMIRYLLLVFCFGP